MMGIRFTILYCFVLLIIFQLTINVYCQHREKDRVKLVKLRENLPESEEDLFSSSEDSSEEQKPSVHSFLARNQNNANSRNEYQFRKPAHQESKNMNAKRIKLERLRNNRKGQQHRNSFSKVQPPEHAKRIHHKSSYDGRVKPKPKKFDFEDDDDERPESRVGFYSAKFPENDSDDSDEAEGRSSILPEVTEEESSPIPNQPEHIRFVPTSNRGEPEHARKLKKNRKNRKQRKHKSSKSRRRHKKPILIEDDDDDWEKPEPPRPEMSFYPSKFVKQTKETEDEQNNGREIAESGDEDLSDEAVGRSLAGVEETPQDSNRAESEEEKEKKADLPKLPEDTASSKFRQLQAKLKERLSYVVPYCPNLHVGNVFRNWGQMFKDSWPNFGDMGTESLHYANELRIQLGDCVSIFLNNNLRKIIGLDLDKKPSTAAESNEIEGDGDGEELSKPKRESSFDADMFRNNFNELHINPIVEFFEKLPEMVQDINSGNY